MLRIGRIYRVGIVTTLSVLVTAYPVYAATSSAAVIVESDVPAIVISEFQTNGGAAAKEFIELYNNTDETISFDSSDWHIQFFNSSSVKTGSPVWTTPITANNSVKLSGTIEANDYFLVASTDYRPADSQPDMSYAAASSRLMTDTGGGLQLLQAGQAASEFLAHDRVMWLAQSGATVLPLGVLISPASGKSLQRIPNDDQEYVSSDGALAAFGPEDAITPLDAWLAPVVEEPVSETPKDTGLTPDDTDTDVPVVAPIANTGLVPPTLTELLPNPASPLTDADDEFIELYNPNTSAFDLGDYKLEVGTSTLRTFTFPDATIIGALQHRAFTSAETGLSLSNSGTVVRLKTPAGDVVSEATAYGTAKDGESWILTDGVWQWSSSATPGVSNIAVLPAAAAVKAVASAKAKKTAAAKVTTARTSKPKTTKIKAAKTAVAKKAKAVKTAAVALPAKPKPPIHVGILVAVVSVAVLYGLYEYRHDIALKFRQLGRNRKPGSPDRFAAAGR